MFCLPDISINRKKQICPQHTKQTKSADTFSGNSSNTKALRISFIKIKRKATVSSLEQEKSRQEFLDLASKQRDSYISKNRTLPFVHMAEENIMD